MQEHLRRPAPTGPARQSDTEQAHQGPSRLPALEPSHLSDADLLSLQAAAGNASVGWLIGRLPVQRAPDVVPYTAETAKTVKETWEKGSVTDTETSANIESQEYMKWRVKAQQAIAGLKQKK